MKEKKHIKRVHLAKPSKLWKTFQSIMQKSQEESPIAAYAMLEKIKNEEMKTLTGTQQSNRTTAQGVMERRASFRPPSAEPFLSATRDVLIAGVMKNWNLTTSFLSPEKESMNLVTYKSYAKTVTQKRETEMSKNVELYNSMLENLNQMYELLEGNEDLDEGLDLDIEEQLEDKNYEIENLGCEIENLSDEVEDLNGQVSYLEENNYELEKENTRLREALEEIDAISSDAVNY